MKEKIIIFGYDLEMGGAEKVLVDIIKKFNTKFDIDLVLLRNKGSLKSELPENIKVYELRKNILSYIFFRFFSPYRRYIINKIANKKTYDVAVGFMEGRSSTFVSDINKDLKKIAFVHNDVLKFNIGISDKEAISSYSSMDKIICVSKQAKQNFCKKYEIPEDKVEVIYNLIDEKIILQKAKEFSVKNDCFTFVNVAKLRKQKRHDRLIKVAKRLKAEGYKFKIDIIGDGPEQDFIESIVHENGVEDIVNLLGLKSNPYPYVRSSDCFVLSSDFEGYGIVIKEALLLQKLIITTDVTGPREILDDGKYGIIVENNTDSLYEGMKRVLDKDQSFQEIIDNLDDYKGDNEKISKQLENLFRCKGDLYEKN